MDFRRSTIVLIITFLCLNVFLLVTYWTARGKNAVLQTRNVDTMEQIKQDGITVGVLSMDNLEKTLVASHKGDLSSEWSSLRGQTVSYEDGVLYAVLSNSISLDMTKQTVADMVEPVTYFVQESVAQGSEYTFYTYDSTNRKIYYVQQMNGLPLLDGTGVLVFQVNASGEVVSYEQSYTTGMKEQGATRFVISQQEAIKTLYLNNKLPAHSYVLSVELAYYRMLTLSETYVYGLAWNVLVRQQDGQQLVKRVDALQNTVLAGESWESIFSTTSTSTSTSN